MTMNAKDFRLWLQAAGKGDRLTYYTGHLAFDREHTFQLAHAPKTVYLEPQHSLGKEVFKAARQKRVHLFQRRLDVNTFEYIAQKRPSITRSKA